LVAPILVIHHDSAPIVSITFDNGTGPKTRSRRKAPRGKPSPPKPHHNRGAHAPTKNAESSANLETIPAHWALHGNAFNPDTGQIAQHEELAKSGGGPHWRRGNSQEIGHLAQGLGKLDPSIAGTNTFFFINHKKTTKGQKVTCLNAVSAFRPGKKDPCQVRWTGNVSAWTADITTAKTLMNSVLSTPNAKLVISDLKDFCLGTPTERFEHMRAPLHMLPGNIMDLCEIHDLMHNCCVHVEIRKGMCGLPQAGKLANDRLQKFLEPHGGSPTDITAGLWTHNTRPIAFASVVDDFAIKCTNPDNAQHLISALEKMHVCSTDWEGKRHCSFSLDWDHHACTCKISMPGHVDRALQRFQHIAPDRPEHSPHAWQKPNCGAKTQHRNPGRPN
jgi:hypothetical protein